MEEQGAVPGQLKGLIAWINVLGRLRGLGCGGLKLLLFAMTNGQRAASSQQVAHMLLQRVKN